MLKSKKKIGILMIFLFLSLCVVTVSAADSFDWRQCKGTTIRFVGNVHPWTKSIKPLIPEFEELTGIKVVFEVFAEEQFRQKLSIELSSRKGLVDVFMLQPHQDARRYSKLGWVEPIGEYVQNSKITNPDFNFEDFTESGIKGETINGRLIGLPIQQSVHLLTYWKDLFEEYGVEVPKDFEELEAAAEKLTLDTDGDGKIDIYGIVNRGRGAAAVHSVSSFLQARQAVYLLPSFGDFQWLAILRIRKLLGCLCSMF